MRLHAAYLAAVLPSVPARAEGVGGIRGPGRRAQTAAGDFVELPCNAGLDASSCDVPLSSLLDGLGDAEEAKIDCGTCAYVDYTGGEVVDVLGGINVEGMLYFPPVSNVELRTTHVFVQGIFKIDPPAAGNKVKFYLMEDATGSDQVLAPHADNAWLCTDGGEEDPCNFGRKAFAVAGGRLDVVAVDPGCPGWVRLADIGTSNTVLTVGTEAAWCWNVGDEIVITDTVHIGVPDANLIGKIASVDEVLGTVTLESEPLTKSGSPSARYVSTLLTDPDFPAEVAWLSRPVILDAETSVVNDDRGGVENNHWHCANDVQPKVDGGHMGVFFTPNQVQRVEGIEINNFGQALLLGKYPFHVHRCGDLQGSEIKRNVVRDSHQRGFVIHATDNLLLEDNVVFGHKGHAYFLEDRVETGNVFRRNFGADGFRLSCSNSALDGKNDHRASTFWVGNPDNSFIDNVAAGSINGFWFDTGGPRDCDADAGVLPDCPENTNTASVPIFTGNVAHNNLMEGVTFYQGGYHPAAVTTFEGNKSYRNYLQGLRLHVIGNLKFKGWTFADNGMGISSFDNLKQTLFEDVTVIGLTTKARQLLSDATYPFPNNFVDYTLFQKKVVEELKFKNYNYKVDGVKFSYDPLFVQLNFTSLDLSGFASHPGVDLMALRLWAMPPGEHNAEGSILGSGDKRFHNMPHFESITIDTTENSFDIEESFVNDPKLGGLENMIDLYFQDNTGVLHADGPGAYVLAEPGPHSFLMDGGMCSPVKEGSKALFCQGACIRRVIALSDCQDGLVVEDVGGFQSVIPSTGGAFAGKTYKHELFLPSGQYSISCEEGFETDLGIITRPATNLGITLDGKGHYLYSNKGVKMWNVQSEPTCQGYVTATDIGLLDTPAVHQKYEGEAPIDWAGGSGVIAWQGESIGIPPNGYATYGPVNFGLAGTTETLRIRYSKPPIEAGGSIKVMQGGPDGELIYTVQCETTDSWEDFVEMDYPISVEGVHQVTLLVERFAGTLETVRIDSFEFLPGQGEPINQKIETESPIAYGSDYQVRFYEGVIAIPPTGYATYGPVNFGNAGDSTVFRIRYSRSSVETGGSLQVILGDQNGEVIADFRMLPLSGWDDFVEMDYPIEATGQHLVTLKVNRWGTSPTVRVDWFHPLPGVDEAALVGKTYNALRPNWWGGNFQVKFWNGIAIPPSGWATYYPVNLGEPGVPKIFRMRYSKDPVEQWGKVRLFLNGVGGDMICEEPLQTTASWSDFVDKDCHIDAGGVAEVTIYVHRFGGTSPTVRFASFEIVSDEATT